MDCTAAAAIYRLPAECVAYAISMTSPEDACQSSAVSPAFKAAADSDAVWARFLPGDHAAILARADEPLRCDSKKGLFSRLCTRPVLLDGATMSFGVERQSGAKCLMLSARALSIAWGHDPSCWTWTPNLPGSRFPEAAELVDVCWLEITGKLQLSLLTPRTTYAAYLVFSIADDSYGLECNVGILPPKATVAVVSGSGKQLAAAEHTICLQHMQGEEEAAVHRRRQEYVRLRRDYGRKLVREADLDIRCPRRRADGWTEVEMGEFAVPVGGGGGEEEEGVVELSLREVECRRWKRGLIVQGIEIRPKHTLTT